MDPRQKLALRSLLKELDGKRARHTELVTVYIPGGFNFNLTMNQLASERGTSENIKSATTRKNVQTALDRMMQQLRLYKQTPPNGLALFAGNVSEREGGADFLVRAIEPPERITTKLYKCDQVFHLDPLKQMMEVKHMYGLIVLDRQEANIAYLKGTDIQQVYKDESMVPGKMRAGGQCLAPDSLVQIDSNKSKPISEVNVGDSIMSYDFKQNRLINSKVMDKWKVKKKVYALVAEDCSLNTSADHLFFLKNGATRAADELKQGNVLLAVNGSKKITSITVEDRSIEMIDISVENENFTANGLIVHNSANRFARSREELAKEFFKKIAEKASKEFTNKPEITGILIGGPGPTKDTFVNEYLSIELKKKVVGVKDIGYTGEQGLYELVHRSQDILAKEELIIQKQAVDRFFEVLNKQPDKAVYGATEVKKAIELGAVDLLLITESYNEKEAEELSEKVEAFGGKWMLISEDMREGAQLKTLGGAVAILRFAIGS